MRAAELAETALSMRNVPSHGEDTWTTFEVIENGELGRQDLLPVASSVRNAALIPREMMLSLLPSRATVSSVQTQPCCARGWKQSDGEQPPVLKH